MTDTPDDPTTYEEVMEAEQNESAAREYDRKPAKGDLLYTAWTVIANVGQGNWDEQTPEWKEAATRWRDEWHSELDRSVSPPSTHTPAKPVSVSPLNRTAYPTDEAIDVAARMLAPMFHDVPVGSGRALFLSPKLTARTVLTALLDAGYMIVSPPTQEPVSPPNPTS